MKKSNVIIDVKCRPICYYICDFSPFKNVKMSAVEPFQSLDCFPRAKKAQVLPTVMWLVSIIFQHEVIVLAGVVFSRVSDGLAFFRLIQTIFDCDVQQIYNKQLNFSLASPMKGFRSALTNYIPEIWPSMIIPTISQMSFSALWTFAVQTEISSHEKTQIP